MHHNSDSSARRPEESLLFALAFIGFEVAGRRRDCLLARHCLHGCDSAPARPWMLSAPGVSGGLICPCLGPAPRLHQAPHPGRAVRLAWVSPLLSSAFAPGWLEGRMWVARRSHVGGLWVARGSHEGGLWVPTSWLADGLEVAWRWLGGGFGWPAKEVSRPGPNRVSARRL